MEENTKKRLVEKWSGLIEDQNSPELRKDLRVGMAAILENQEQYYKESVGTQTTDVINFTKVLVPIARRIFPQLLANQIVGIQPLNAPTGFAYALRYSYAGTKEKPLEGMIAQDRGGAVGHKNFDALSRNGQQVRAASKFDSAAVILDGAEAAVGEKVFAATGGDEIGEVVYSEGGQVMVKFSGTKTAADLATNSDTLVFGADNTSTDNKKAKFVTDNEAGWNTLFKYYSGNPAEQDGWFTTQQGEHLGEPGNPMREMKLALERIAVEVKSRKLKARYTHELATDLRNEFNIDAETQLINILEYEIVAEIDRDLVDRINGAATKLAKSQGWAYATKTPAGDLSTHANGIISDGQWEAEKFRTLYTKVVKEANHIQKTTRRGAANFIIASSNVITALQSLRNFMPWNLDSNMDANSGGVTRVGTLDNRFAVYMDAWAMNDYITLGYKGRDQFDTGIVYCPYTMMNLHKSQDAETFQPIIGFSSRAAIVDNIWGASNYYRSFGVSFEGSTLEGVYYL